MPKEIANDLIHTNAEYEKLKSNETDGDSTPRETPAGQGPGRRGYDKALFASWTRDELVAHLKGLGVDVDVETERESLVEQLESRDATLRRSGA